MRPISKMDSAPSGMRHSREMGRRTENLVPISALFMMADSIKNGNREGITVVIQMASPSDAEERAVFASNMSSSIPIALIISDSTLLFFIGSPP